MQSNRQPLCKTTWAFVRVGFVVVVAMVALVALGGLTVVASGAAVAQDEANPSANSADGAGIPATGAQDEVVAQEGAQDEEGEEEREWLTDDEGRRFYVERLPKLENRYRRLEDNKIRTRWGIDVELYDEDDDWFYYKVYEVGERTLYLQDRSKPTAEEIAAVEASYTVELPESDILTYQAMDGLPGRGQWRHGFELADMNGDGLLDLVHGSPRKPPAPPAIYLGQEDGWKRWAIELPRLGYDYGDVAVADFNQDGHMDVAYAMHLKGVAVLLGDGEGKFRLHNEGVDYVQPGKGKPLGFTSRAIEAVDWNGDGLPDLVVLGEGPRLGLTPGPSGSGYDRGSRGTVLYINRGEDGWEKQDFGAGGNEPFGDSLTIGDVNGDGRPDFITASHVQGLKGILHLGREDGRWDQVALDLLRPGTTVHASAIGDFNGDGRMDLATTFRTFELAQWRNGIDVFLAQEDGSWKRVPVIAREGTHGFRSLATGDVDGDGHLDLVGAAETNDVWIFRGDGEGSFIHELSPELQGPEGDCRGYHVVLEDLDDDGMAEIVASFAGESSGVFNPTSCPTMGSLQAWDGSLKNPVKKDP